MAESMIPPTITDTSLWRRTLADQGRKDPRADFREHLRDTFRQFRQRASVVAQTIPEYLHNHTVHDITHIDSLWRVADQLCGLQYPLNPPEAFVLGGAFLIHDLGLALASYPYGLGELKDTQEWRLALVRVLRETLGRAPQQAEMDNLASHVEEAAIDDTLRRRHAKQAEGLATEAFRDPDSSERYFLIQDDDLRNRWGDLIGRIAYSHWWSVNRLREEIDTVIGGPPGFPEWEIDPFKLACILRAADACHLDGSRAPVFLRAIRRPRGTSALHWGFQSHLQATRVNNCRVVFTSSRPFLPEEAEAWWLCHDTLQGVDSELRHIDSLLRDTNRQPLLAHGVAGMDDSVGLTQYVKTEGWSPVDGRVRITDAVSLIQRLGGEGLYGQEPFVPLRELIQNAADAVRARRIEEKRDDTWGAVTVRLGHDEFGCWVEFEDSGIGMSQEVLTGPLLDFGTTYWGSHLMAREHPDLVASTFESVGRFGIGFFSVFMWGKRVRVTTRRQEDGIADTRVLEFGEQGLQSRPILRRANRDEQRYAPGTSVRVWLRLPFPHPHHEGTWLLGRLAHFEAYRGLSTIDSLRALCAWLCPTLDVNVEVEVLGEPRQAAITANDWITLDSYDLLRRVTPLLERYHESWTPEYLRDIAPNLRTIANSDGRVVARACLRPHGGAFGVVTAGGFRANPTTLVLGVFVGTPTSITRQWARPIAEQEAIASWATEQGEIALKYPSPKNIPAHFAQIVRSVGGDTGQLVIGRGADGLLNRHQIASESATGTEILLVEQSAWSQHVKDRPDLKPLPHVFVVSNSAMGNMREICPHDFAERTAPAYPRLRWNTLAGAAVEAICQAWGVGLRFALECSEFFDVREAPLKVIGRDNDGPLEGKVLGILRRP